MTITLSWMGHPHNVANHPRVVPRSKFDRRGRMESMPSRKKGNKRDAILDAMLDVVVERGFHEAPMSLIAERSGASTGVIYHHFASKEEIIQAVYDRTCSLKTEGFLKGYSPEMNAKEAFLHVWANCYDFYRKHPREMRFMEQYALAGFPRVAEPAAAEHEFFRRFQGRAKGGVLKDWPTEILQEMTLGLVARLASSPKKWKPATLREVAEKTWESVKAD
jgi:TetR/AcrR family transcriptional regulator, repressor of fatR-cypB operon